MQSSRDRIQWIIATRCSGKQNEFARSAGVDSGSVSKWLSGEQNPGARSLKAIAAAFSLSSQWLQSGHGSPEADLSESQESTVYQIAYLKGRLDQSEADLDRVLIEHSRRIEAVLSRCEDRINKGA